MVNVRWPSNRVVPAFDIRLEIGQRCGNALECFSVFSRASPRHEESKCHLTSCGYRPFGAGTSNRPLRSRLAAPAQSVKATDVLIRKNPLRFSVYRSLGVLTILGVTAYFLQDPDDRSLVLVCMLLGLVFVFVQSIILPFLGGIEIEGDVISTVTEFGGIEEVKLSEIDNELSFYNGDNLVLVANNGIKLSMLAADYSPSDIELVAEMAGVLPP